MADRLQCLLDRLIDAKPTEVPPHVPSVIGFVQMVLDQWIGSDDFAHVTNLAFLSEMQDP